MNHLKSYALCALFLPAAQGMYAQTEEDDPFSAMQAEFDDFKVGVDEEYGQFRKQVNEEYAEFMKNAWKNFDRSAPIPQPEHEEVKPLVLPDKEKGKPIPSRPIKIQVVAPVLRQPQPVPIEPIVPTEPIVIEQLVLNKPMDTPVKIDPVKVKPIEAGPIKLEGQRLDPLKLKAHEFKGVTAVCYGTQVKVHFTEDERFTLKSLKPDDISNAWKALSDKRFNNTLADCLNLRDVLGLGDWAYLNLLEQVAQAALGKSNEATLLAAFLYCQSGYQMRLGKTATHLVLLFASQHVIYGQSFFPIGNTRFYPFHSDGESRMSICDLAYPKEKELSLLLTDEQGFAEQPTPERTLVSAIHPDMTVKASVNKNLLDFYADYPTSAIGDNQMTRWAMYANTPLQRTLRESIYPTLRQKLQGKTPLEAVNRLLNFVQTSLKYEYDEVVWGHDRAFFAEESLFYPYADCEDRSILFSRLVRDLLGLNVVLIYYPGHLATAVHFPQAVDGDYLILGGERFTICDPTYIGASVGMTMPNMDNLQAQAILLEN